MDREDAVATRRPSGTSRFVHRHATRLKRSYEPSFFPVETRFLNEPAERLAIPDDPVLAANARRLNDVVFAPLDYAILATT